jgi:hypothetical protein
MNAGPMPLRNAVAGRSMFSHRDLREYKSLEAAQNPRLPGTPVLSSGVGVTAAGWQQPAAKSETRYMRLGEIMIVIGLILLIVGFLTGITILWTIGIIVLLLGLIALLLGSIGHPVGGRRHYW